MWYVVQLVGFMIEESSTTGAESGIGGGNSRPNMADILHALPDPYYMSRPICHRTWNRGKPIFGEGCAVPSGRRHRQLGIA
ncbi:hypothetical protein N7510_006658 [Penicillium lagena]|uniref:uncharacterized protein n=1 Tax=Penicillium lagena TaxID=94218 RepID=UPI0025418AC3|nr:uncharacterized protein N7510_006658 [Penicillium lagena]KAJ5609939.1 hypothetical protein N7510_006658 [Penicillium lagena]